MEQVKELLDNNPFAIDGMNFTEFKAYCKTLGIKDENQKTTLAIGVVFYLLIFPHSHERVLLDSILRNILNLCLMSDSYFKEVKNLF